MIGPVLIVLLAALGPLAGTPGVNQPYQWSPRGALLIEGATVVTMNDAHTIIPDARVLVRKGKIAAIWTGKTPPAGVFLGDAAAVNAGPNDLLFPGLINLHSHPTFNHLHSWPPPTSHAIPVEGKNGSEPYANRYQWGGGGLNYRAPTSHLRLVVNPSSVLVEDWGLDLRGEVIKYAEVAALLGGETSIQGAGTGLSETNRVLVRNIGFNSFGVKISSWVPSIDSLVSSEKNESTYGEIKAGLTAGTIGAWLVHLAEGVDDDSRAEFQTLKSNGLLTDATVIIHGIALKSADFDAMRAAPPFLGGGLGAKLVWSPLSNLRLYGATTNFYWAHAADVVVSLGTDWSPSGSRTLLQELKIADIAARDPRILGASRELVPAFALKGKSDLGRLAAEAALDRALVDMVTRNPARSLRWYDKVGSIEVGKAADLMLLHRPSAGEGGAKPTVYRELINATEQDVKLVVVGGDPLAGNVGLMNQLKGSDKEVVTSDDEGFSKAVDVTTADPLAVEGHETLAEFTAEIEAGLTGLDGESDPSGATIYSYLKSHAANGFYAAKSNYRFELFLANHVGRRRDGSLNLEAVQLAPLFAADDDFLGYLLRAEVDIGGVIADPTPPFDLYPANFNQLTPRGNPFAQWSAGGN